MKLEIPKPCNAQYKEFEKTKEGGFCQHCATEVIDFTIKSDEEIFDFFLKSKGKICGRLPSREMKFETVAPQLPKRGLAAASISLLSLGALDANAQHNTIAVQGEVVAHQIDQEKEREKQQEETWTVKGRFLEKGTNRPVEGGAITFEGGEGSAISDARGHWFLRIPATTQFLDPIELYFQKEGMSTVTKVIYQPKGDMNLGDVHLEVCTQGTVLVKGRVLYEANEEPLIYSAVSVIGKNSQIGVITNLDGEFEFLIPREEVTDNMQLKIAFIGCETNIIELSSDKEELMLGDIYMKEAEFIMIGLICPAPMSTATKIKYKLKRFFGFSAKRH